MWLAIFGVSILAGVAGIVYLAGKIEKSGLFNKIDSRAVTMSLAFIAVLIIVVMLCFLFDVTNTIVIVIHVAVFLLAGDFVGFILKKASHPVSGRIIDLVAVLLCFVYFAIGWFLMHGLWETDYAITTTKDIGELKVAQIADSHVGCGFDGEGFGKRLEKIQTTSPDVLVITGDFVDDSTSKEDMVTACAALGRFKTRYGIYYCFGNHDRGYYSDEKRGYGGDDLVAELKKNGVIVLEDESVLIDDRCYIIGRKDAGYGGSDRMSASELLEGLDKDKYTIMLDHQPTDYDAEAGSGVDLVLSGHTHGGQLWPLEYIQPIVSSNDNVRGHERRGNTDFIVTDGISDWAIKFRTGCRSEYNIIDISQKH